MTTTAERLTTLDEQLRADHRLLGGFLSVGGAVVTASGAIVNAVIGLDLDAALADDTMADYLSEAAGSTTAIMVNISLWIAGGLIMTLGMTLLSHSVRPSPAASIGRFGAIAGAASLVMFFPLMMGLVLGLQGRPELAAVGVSFGQGATISDWVGTVLVFAVAPGGIALAGSNDWVPGRVVKLAQATMALGVLTIIGLIIGAVSPLGVPVVVVGLVLIASLGVSAIRKA